MDGLISFRRRVESASLTCVVSYRGGTAVATRHAGGICRSTTTAAAGKSRLWKITKWQATYGTRELRTCIKRHGLTDAQLRTEQAGPLEVSHRWVRLAFRTRDGRLVEGTSALPRASQVHSRQRLLTFRRYPSLSWPWSLLFSALCVPGLLLRSPRSPGRPGPLSFAAGSPLVSC